MNTSSVPFEWTADAVRTLIQLWDEGLSSQKIADRMGLTKNAIIGKVHRLGLPKRKPAIKGQLSKHEKEQRSLSLEKKRQPTGCRFIHGDPRDKEADDWHYCQAPLKNEESPYCSTHHRMTHTGVRVRSELKRDASTRRSFNPALNRHTSKWAGAPDPVSDV